MNSVRRGDNCQPYKPRVKGMMRSKYFWGVTEGVFRNFKERERESNRDRCDCEDRRCECIKRSSRKAF